MNREWLKTNIRRREFIGAVGGAAVGTALGVAIGREIEYRHENPAEVTVEPLEIQIRKLELRGDQEGLKNKELRELHAWLVCSWYGAIHSFGAFADPNNEYAAAQKMYSSISLMEDEHDPRLQDQESFAGLTVPRESVWINLTSPELREAYLFNTSGGVITPLMQERDILVHELTHFITEFRKDGQIIAAVEQLRPDLADITDVTISGFRLLFDPDPDDSGIPVIRYLDDFDEATTELIANYYQRTAGLSVGLPSYPEGDQSETGQYRIEKTLDALEATLKLSGISMDQFAELHAHSDLDGLAVKLADSTNNLFQSDLEKIEYGLSIIIALKELKHEVLGKHIQNIRS